MATTRKTPSSSKTTARVAKSQKVVARSSRPMRSSKNTSSASFLSSTNQMAIPAKVLIPVLSMLVLSMSLLLLMFVRERSLDDRAGAVAALQEYEETQLGTGLVGYWRMDGSNGLAKAAFGAIDLRGKSDLTIDAGKIGRGIMIKSNDEVESVGTIKVSSREMTIAGWFQTTTIGETPLFSLTQADGEVFTLSVRRGAQPVLIVRSESGVDYALPIGAQDVNEWFFASLALEQMNEDVKISLRLNDTIASTVVEGVMVPGEYTLRLGFDEIRRVGGQLEIDELGIWSKVLTQTQLNGLFGAGSGVTFPFPQL